MIKSKHAVTDVELTQLRVFLESPARPEGTFCLEQLYGYLFTVVSAPAATNPSEWLPIIFNDEEAGFASIDEANSILPIVMAIYNDVNRQVLERSPVLPDCCQPHADVMQNFDPDSPLAMWAQGFLEGHDVLVDIWDNDLPDDLSEELGSCMMILSFFASEELAMAFHEESDAVGESLEDMAATMLLLFPDAMRTYANLGRSIFEAKYELEHEKPKPFFADPKISRNDVCPCGSGKKYKHCCLH